MRALNGVVMGNAFLSVRLTRFPPRSGTNDGGRRMDDSKKVKQRNVWAGDDISWCDVVKGKRRGQHVMEGNGQDTIISGFVKKNSDHLQKTRDVKLCKEAFAAEVSIELLAVAQELRVFK